MTRLAGLSFVFASVLAVACTSPAPPAPAADAPADLEAISMVRSKFASAYTAGDADAIAAMYTDDAVSQTNMMPTATGKAAIAEQLKGMFAQNTMQMAITPDETHTMGDTGWERGHYTATMTPKAGGATMTMDGRYMILLQKGADGSWKVRTDMDNTATPPPAPAPPAADAK